MSRKDQYYIVEKKQYPSLRFIPIYVETTKKEAERLKRNGQEMNGGTWRVRIFVPVEEAA